MDNSAIGVFDSGIGGLTVLKRLIEIMPNEKYIYYADVKNVPYGIKDKEDVKEYIYESIDFLIEKKVKAIVIACNTATAIAIEELRKKYSIPIIGIEPAVKPAIETRKNKKVLIMATPTTLKEDKLKRLIEKLQATKYVDMIEMSKLVNFAEKNEYDSLEVEDYIKKQLEKYNLNEYSKLVLGCTHFPLFKGVLRRICGNNIEVIDGGIGVANHLNSILKTNNICGNNSLEIEYYYSGIQVENKENLENILNKYE